MRFPFLVPKPIPLSLQVEALSAIEDSNWYSNFGPVNSEFEQALVRDLFSGKGSCVTVANATLGLMLAIRHALGDAPKSARPRYAIMPSFSFAAAADAVDWCGLVPLFCDVDKDTWLLDPGAISDLIQKYGEDVALIFPYATFGNSLDLKFYETLRDRHGIPVVVDAAASLGAYDKSGRHFGQGSSLPLVFSMHATKAFSTAEGGIVYCGNSDVIDSIRSMSNFGFDSQRRSILPGLNAKLSEYGALLGREKLKEFPKGILHRQSLYDCYHSELRGLKLQVLQGKVPAYQLLPALLDSDVADQRSAIMQQWHDMGLETRSYFSPCLHQHPYFAKHHQAGPLKVTNDIARRILNFPLNESLSILDVKEICSLVNHQLKGLALSKSA